MLGMLYWTSSSGLKTNQFWSKCLLIWSITEKILEIYLLNIPTRYNPVETCIDRDWTRPSSAQWGDPHLQTHQWPATTTTTGTIGWWVFLWSELRNLFHGGSSSPPPPSSSWMEMRTKENSHGSSWTGSLRWRTDDGDSILRARRPPAYGKEMKSIENQWDGNEILSDGGEQAC